MGVVSVCTGGAEIVHYEEIFMKRLIVVVLTLFLAVGSLIANPPKITSDSLFCNGNMEVFNGVAKIDGNVADGEYFAYVIWECTKVWGQTLHDRMAFLILLDMEHDIPDDHIYFGDADNNPMTPYISKLTYRYNASDYCGTALVKVVVENHAITRIYADDDAWKEYVRLYGPSLTSRY